MSKGHKYIQNQIEYVTLPPKSCHHNYWFWMNWNLPVGSVTSTTVVLSWLPTLQVKCQN